MLAVSTVAVVVMTADVLAVSVVELVAVVDFTYCLVVLLAAGFT